MAGGLMTSVAKATKPIKQRLESQSALWTHKPTHVAFNNFEASKQTLTRGRGYLWDLCLYLKSVPDLGIRESVSMLILGTSSKQISSIQHIQKGQRKGQPQLQYFSE